ncbi:MAG: hypothetical protein AMXMBFR53_27500 [Gemmatimonadota bacterium]
MNALLLALLLALAPPAGAGASASPGGGAVHDLHVSYGAAAVEGSALTVRIRFFKDDLEGALARHAGLGEYGLRPGPDADSAFLAYMRAHFSVTVAGRTLEPAVVGSGEDELDREPVWWYAVQFEADAPLTAFRVRNTLLLELFDDQTNIVKFVHFPDQKQKTYSFGEGAEQFEVRFP